jgi:hypothetical protein
LKKKTRKTKKRLNRRQCLSPAFRSKINQRDDLVGSKETLANVLRKFYAEARKRDG